MYLPHGFLKKLSSTTGITKTNLSSYLSGNKRPSFRTLKKLDNAKENIPELACFSKEDWLFRPNKIKKYIISLNKKQI